MNSNILRGLAAVAAVTIATASHAAIDVSTATTGITDAQTAVIIVIGAMITFAGARYGLRKVLGLLGR